MSRVKRGTTTRKRHKKLFKLAKGYKHGRRKVYRNAKQAVIRAGQYAYRDRHNKKRVFRSLWIVKINAACRAQGVSYSRFIKALNDKKIDLDRKILADLAENHPEEFSKILEKVKAK